MYIFVHENRDETGKPVTEQLKFDSACGMCRTVVHILIVSHSCFTFTITQWRTRFDNVNSTANSQHTLTFVIHTKCWINNSCFNTMSFASIQQQKKPMVFHGEEHVHGTSAKIQSHSPVLALTELSYVDETNKTSHTHTHMYLRTEFGAKSN